MTAHLDRSGQLCSLAFGLLSPELEHLAQVLSSQRSATRLWRATDRSVDKIRRACEGAGWFNPPPTPTHSVTPTKPRTHAPSITHAHKNHQPLPVLGEKVMLIFRSDNKGGGSQEALVRRIPHLREIQY
jgi:hypothetical protein